MANYNVQISNGQGSAVMQSGNYAVSATANGYDGTTLSPTTYTASTESGTGSFTLSAAGVLTLIFNETGAQGGAPITSGSVVMTDQTGTVEYGTPREINAVGVATFETLPYNAEIPYLLYFKQLSTDGTHIIYSGVIPVGMGLSAQTEYIQNIPITAEQTFSLNDQNYGFPISTATLQFTAE
ncbi:MAG: hypothetical protein SPL13_02185 [Clostridia bacterium]|nr:hypothetical protein [Clostridia bacterium]